MTVTAMPVVKAQKASMPWSTLEEGEGFSWLNKKQPQKTRNKTKNAGFPGKKKLLQLGAVASCFLLLVFVVSRGFSLYNYTWIFHVVGGVEGMEPS